MKKINIYFILILALTTIFCEKANSQCREQMVYSCSTGHGIYLQDLNTKLQKSNNETKWIVVLNKDYRYRFSLCTSSEDNNVALTLYDSQSNICISTYNKTNNKDYRSIDFICRESGTYYVSINFKKGYKLKKTCAVGIMEFIDKIDD